MHGGGGHPARRKGCDIYTQNFNNLNASDTQRTPSFNPRNLNDIHRSSNDTHRNPSEVTAAQHLSFHEATQIDIAEFKRYVAQHYQPNTMRVTLTHLRAFFNYLVEQGEVLDNPVRHVDAVKTVKLAPKWLNRNEQNALIRAVRKHGTLRELMLVTLMLHTGLRVQEVADLRLADLQLG